ncbi:hypothetical protein C8A01DRAFT_38588 [Parachaetomium inaequale]|uniref:Uncharacterized protein n=1 Tax=Parachaetomium inaequale TaxID=2588326 RepID=A0AAN6PAV4_9PEZI|nr:hypothetical protein C8A01DRAFT_38588 [Parachaetomium inaequale]
MAPAPLTPAAAAAAAAASTLLSTASTSAVNWGHLQSPEFYGALSALLPALAFPLLPCGPAFACETALAVAAFCSLCGIQLFNFAFWMTGCAHSDFPAWILPLAAASLLVADGRYCAMRQTSAYASSHMSETAPWTGDNFAHHARWTYVIVLYTVSKCVASAFFEWGASASAPVLSLHNGGVAFALVLGNFLVLYLVHTYQDVFLRPVAIAYFRVTERQVPGCFWISEKNKFGPLWSKFLWVLVVVSGPALWALWAVSLHVSKPVG